MKYLKYFENIDPYEEEWESEEPYTEFENWLLYLRNYCKEKNIKLI